MPTLNDAPSIKKQAEEAGFDTHTKAEALPEGTVLNITSISPEITKTKNGYELMTFTDADKGELVTLATAIKNKLKDVLADQEEGFDFGADDPLTCTITSYESHGRTCKALA